MFVSAPVACFIAIFQHHITCCGTVVNTVYSHRPTANTDHVCRFPVTEQCDVALYAGMSNSLAQTLAVSNYVFTGLFALEMLLKLFALGFFEYVADRFNCFDGVVVILSVVEIILDVSTVVMCFLCLTMHHICLVLHAMQLLEFCVAHVPLRLAPIVRYSMCVHHNVETINALS